MPSDGTVSDAHTFLVVILVVVVIAAVASIGIGIWKPLSGNEAG